MSQRKKTKKTENKKKPKKSTRSFPWSVFFTVVIWLGMAAGGVTLWFMYDLPDLSHLMKQKRQAGVTVLARDGALVATFGDCHGSLVCLDKLPRHAVSALLSTEDRRFYDHFGVDVWGILRATMANVRGGRVMQGGSTLTQQLAKNLLISSGLYTPQDRSFRRKIQEVLLAFKLEWHLSKRQILTIYLNRVYFGSGVYGLGAASQRYFQKKPEKLSLLESALLMGLLKAPSKYAPTHNLTMAEDRAKAVLESMKEGKYITAKEHEKALANLSSLGATHAHAILGRYFSDWIFDQILSLMGEIDQDIVVHTTLDPPMQSTAEDLMQAMVLMEGQKYHVGQGALVAMTPKGAVRAMVGGVDYMGSPFNRAVQAKRQTGSVFKPFVYMAAFEQGKRPSDMIQDGPIRLGKWQPKNYAWTPRGQVSIEQGFAYSLNTVTVRLAHGLGWKPIHDLVKRLGIASPLRQDLSISLGSGEASLLEMTGAYAVLANHGYSVKPYGIESIRTIEGKRLYDHGIHANSRPIVSGRVCADMVHCLRAVMDYGTGRRSRLNRPCAGKSGTSQKHRDAWFIGFTPDLVTGVWMGNDNEKPMERLTGGRLPGRLWHDFMESVHGKLPKRSFPSS